MGIGDEIIATAQAREAQTRDPRRVRILDINGAPRWHPIWNGNPRLARMTEKGDFQTLSNAPGLRPYIEAKTVRRWLWRDWQCTPGEIYLSDEELAFADRVLGVKRPDIIIEPTLKSRASPNKQWHGWQEFARLAKQAGFRLTQLGFGPVQLPDVELIHTPDFRGACAVLARARAYVGHEGGLHHAAAALGVPAVVIFGGFISPAQTGYATHRNLFTGGAPCGMRVPCRHCDHAMAAITPPMVLQYLTEMLNASPGQ